MDVDRRQLDEARGAEDAAVDDHAVEAGGQRRHCLVHVRRHGQDIGRRKALDHQEDTATGRRVRFANEGLVALDDIGDVAESER